MSATLNDVLWFDTLQPHLYCLHSRGVVDQVGKTCCVEDELWAARRVFDAVSVNWQVKKMLTIYVTMQDASICGLWPLIRMTMKHFLMKFLRRHA